MYLTPLNKANQEKVILLVLVLLLRHQMQKTKVKMQLIPIIIKTHQLLQFQILLLKTIKRVKEIKQA